MRKYLALFPALAALASGSSALAGGASVGANNWTCRNVDVEIACDADGCEAASAHTPMAVSVSPSTLSVCAYSGCWEGRTSGWLKSGRFQTFSASDLPFSTDHGDPADVSVTVDTATGIGTILVSGRYAHPARCMVQ